MPPELSKGYTRNNTILTQVACPPLELPGHRRLFFDFFRIVKERSRTYSVKSKEWEVPRALCTRRTPHTLRLTPCFEFGGGERDRTDDPLLAKQVLSQLSYTPEWTGWWVWLDSNQRPPPYQDGALTN